MRLYSWFGLFLLTGFLLITGLTHQNANAETGDFSGLYVGASVGYGHNSLDGIFDTAGTAPFATGNDLEDDGFIAGGQLGYNLQFGKILVGIDASINNSEIKGDFVDGEIDRQEFDIDWYTTFQIRLGFVLGDLLAYVSGGGHYTESQLVVENKGANEDFSEVNGAFGGGLEYKVTDSVSFLVDAQYLLLSENSDLSSLPDADSGDFWETESIVAIKFGVNYHF